MGKEVCQTSCLGGIQAVLDRGTTYTFRSTIQVSNSDYFKSVKCKVAFCRITPDIIHSLCGTRTAMNHHTIFANAFSRSDHIRSHYTPSPTPISFRSLATPPLAGLAYRYLTGELCNGLVPFSSRYIPYTLYVGLR
jgi:hypothetical protein